MPKIFVPLLLAALGGTSILAPAVAASPTPTAVEQQVLDIDQAWVDAEMRHDETALRHILSDRFVATFDAGAPIDREAMIGLVIVRLRDVTTRQVLLDRKVVLDGDTAVVTEADALTQTSKAGVIHESATRLTATYLRRDGAWKALALHLVTAQDKPVASGGAKSAAPVQSEAERRLHDDWAWIGRYRAENAALVASGVRPDVVFMGDSITEGWPGKAPATFAAGRIGRGISGQTTPQMLVRFREDVIALHPRAVHLMAGTNDIAANTGPMTPEETHANIASMAELARANGIAVVLGAVPPAAAFSWKPGLETAQAIRALNAWLRAYAARVGATYADYTAVLDDGRGGMKPGFADDGVHPTAAGYAAMAPVTDAAIAHALNP